MSLDSKYDVAVILPGHSLAYLAPRPAITGEVLFASCVCVCLFVAMFSTTAAGNDAIR